MRESPYCHRYLGLIRFLSLSYEFKFGNAMRISFVTDTFSSLRARHLNNIKWLSLVLLIFPASAQVITIDNFESGDFAAIGGIQLTQSPLPASDVVGGLRQVSMAGGGASNLYVTDGALRFEKGDNSLLEIIYGDVSGGGNPGRILHLDLSKTAYIAVDVESLTAPFSIGFQLRFDAGFKFSQVLRDISQPGITTFPISEFMSPYNLADVYGLWLSTFYTPGNTDFRISDIYAVPEPASFAAISGVALLGYGFARRRARNNP
jgi:hypothetical protein